MLRIKIHNLGDVAVFICSGRIVYGCKHRLLNAFSTQLDLRIAVLDLATVTAIDTAGVGSLVSVRDWASANGVPLKLMNLSPTIEGLLERTHLGLGFEICSVAEMLDLLCRAFRQSQRVEADVSVEWRGQVLDDGGPVLVQVASSSRGSQK